MVANMTFGVNLIPKTDNTYSLGNSDHKWAIYGDVQPIASEVYENYTVSANDIDNGFIYFLKLDYDDTSNTYIPKSIHYILEVTTSEARTQGYYDVWIGICETGAYRYKIFNHFSSELYYPIYGHIILASNENNLDKGAYLGVRVNGARTPTTLARTYNIKVLEVNGCTVDFLDSIQKYSVLYDSTYYVNTEFNGTSIGLQESGDMNSLIVNEVSGTIASFKDGADNMPMESVIANIEPIQDLHGYDSPWPAGGGKNLLPIRKTAGTSHDLTYTPVVVDDNVMGVSVSGTQDGTASVLNIMPDGQGITLPAGTYKFSGGTDTAYVLLRRDTSGGDQIVQSKGAVNEFTLAEDTLVFCNARCAASTDTFSNVMLYPMITLASETDDTFAPYTNIAPISGRTGLSVTRVRKNLIDIEDFSLVMGTNRTKFKTLPQMLPAGDYIVSFDVTANTATKTTKFTVMTASGGTTVANQNIAAGSTGHYIKTFTADKPFGLFYVFLNVQETDSNSVTFANVQLEPGSTATTYEPYNGDTYTVDWTTEAGTVYGGTLDVVTGLLTVDRAIVDLGTLTWDLRTTGLYMSSIINDIKLVSSQADIVQGIAENYQVFKYSYAKAHLDEFVIGMNQGEKRIFVSGGAAGTGKFVYALATPQTYQLTSQQIASLLGENNVFADCGDTSVKYYADTKLYINNKTPTKTSDLINDNHFAPQYFAYCNTPAKTVTKVVNIPEITQLTTGLTISVQFQYANSANNPEISLNGGAGIALYRGASVVGSGATTSWVSGSVVTFTYDGTYWQLTNYNNTTYSSMTEADATAGTATSARLITAARLKQAIETHAPVSDVKINGTSILLNKNANIPLAANDEPGVVKVSSTGAGGIGTQVNGGLVITTAEATEIKAGSNTFKPITPSNQDSAVFYGLAAAAGDSTQSASSNAVGAYTDGAKNAIQAMIGIGMGVEQVSGTTPTITAAMNTRYICGEVTTLSITPPAQGSCEVIFTVGNYLTALTLPSTVKMPEWFMIETNRIYDIIITDGIYGAVMSWEA